MLKKKICKKILKKNWKKTLEKNLRARNISITTKSEEKSLFFFCFGCTTQNKALDMMKLVSKIFFFIKEFMV